MKKELSEVEAQSIISTLESYLVDLKAKWDQTVKSRSWWKLKTDYLVQSTTFLINAIDELILFVEQIIPSGTDKKAAVIALLSKTFDYIATTGFPIWLKPFIPVMKRIVINIIISNLIDFFVSKYNAGFWKATEQKEQNGQEAQKTIM